MIPAIQPRREQIRQAARRGFATATDLADYLVRKGVPFRDAHEVVGKAVRLGVETGRDLAEMALSELQQFSPLIQDDVFAALALEGSVAARRWSGWHRAAPGAGCSSGSLTGGSDPEPLPHENYSCPSPCGV